MQTFFVQSKKTETLDLTLVKWLIKRVNLCKLKKKNQQQKKTTYNIKENKLQTEDKSPAIKHA